MGRRFWSPRRSTAVVARLCRLRLRCAARAPVTSSNARGGAPCRAELARGVLHVLAGRVLSLGSRGSGRRQVPSQPENRCTITPIEHPVWSERTVDVTSEQTGIFYPLVARG